MSLIIPSHIKAKKERTTGLKYHALCQRLLVGRSTRGTMPAPYLEVQSPQVNQTPLREMKKDSLTYYTYRRCRRPPYYRVEWAHGQSDQCESAAAGRRRLLRYQWREYLILGKIKHVLVDPLNKRTTVGAVCIGSYTGSWDIAEALQSLWAGCLSTSHRSRKRVEYREVKYWGRRNKGAG